MATLYRNWPEICKIVRPHPFLALELSTINLESEMAKEFAEVFPRFFSETEVLGPVPLSVLKEGSSRSFLEENCEFSPKEAEERWEERGAYCSYWQTLNIPVFLFDTNGAIGDTDLPEKFRPIAESCKPLEVVSFEGRDFFVLYKDDYVKVCPAEVIFNDLDG